MNSQKKLIVSHAPFLHNGSSISERNLHIIYAALPAVLLGGIFRFGIPAIGVVCLSVSTAMLWELIMNRAMQRPVSIGDGNAALIGLLFAMLLPATAPWWLVITGTFVAIVIGKQIFGGIGGNAFNPVALSSGHPDGLLEGLFSISTPCCSTTTLTSSWPIPWPR